MICKRSFVVEKIIFINNFQQTKTFLRLRFSDIFVFLEMFLKSFKNVILPYE